MLGAAFGIAPAREGLGETQSDAQDLLRNTISATVNKVYLDRFLEEYQDGGKKELWGAAKIAKVIAGKKDSSMPALSPIERTVQLRLYRPFLLPVRCSCGQRVRERSVPAAD